MHLIDKLSLARFRKDRRASVALWGALIAPVMIGGAALSVDTARIYNMDHDLQAASDALARAGAAELDQRGDSLQRASRAITTLVRNDQKFAKAGRADIQIDTIKYYKSIPNNDYEDIPQSELTFNPSEARYVEVTLKPETVSTLFPAGMLQKITDVSLSSKSVAGLGQGVCGVAPVFICNPYEGETTSIYQAMDDPAFRRKQIQFKTPAKGGSNYGRGNFGWLDPFGGNSGASVIADAVAIDIPDVCMDKRAGVQLRTGNIASMRKAVNTRFDMYEGEFKKKRTDPAYAPAANVVKGMVAGKDACKLSASSSALGMPRDKCHDRNNCGTDGNRMGDGNWDFISYMAINHNYMRQITIKDVTYRIDYRRWTMNQPNPPSRYDLYRWEIDFNCVPGAKTYGRNARTPEEGLPQCHASGPSTTVADRRIIHAAVLNCQAIEAESPKGMWRRKDALPVETFVKVFLTEPMGKGQQNILFGEIVGPVISGQDVEAVDQVALAR